MNVTPTNTDVRSEFTNEKTDADHAFAERMEAIILDAGGAAQLARKADLSEGVIAKYRKLQSDPSRKRLEALAAAAKVRVEWLVTGKGPKSSNDVPSDLYGQTKNQKQGGATPSATDSIMIPRFDARLSAGPGAFSQRAEVLDHIPFTPQFLRRKLGRGSIEGLVIVETAGDSMEPTISDGDLVMIDTHDTIPHDGLYALVVDNALFVKRLHKMVDGLEIGSDNRDLYRPTTLPRDRIDEVTVVGRVRWIGRVV